jgi:hypothetical protein
MVLLAVPTAPRHSITFFLLAKAARAGGADSARSEMRTVKQLAFGRNIAQQGAPNRKHQDCDSSTGASFSRGHSMSGWLDRYCDRRISGRRDSVFAGVAMPPIRASGHRYGEVPGTSIGESRGTTAASLGQFSTLPDLPDNPLGLLQFG